MPARGLVRGRLSPRVAPQGAVGLRRAQLSDPRRDSSLEREANSEFPLFEEMQNSESFTCEREAELGFAARSSRTGEGNSSLVKRSRTRNCLLLWSEAERAGIPALDRDADLRAATSRRRLRPCERRRSRRGDQLPGGSLRRGGCPGAARGVLPRKMSGGSPAGTPR